VASVGYMMSWTLDQTGLATLGSQVTRPAVPYGPAFRRIRHHFRPTWIHVAFDHRVAAHIGLIAAFAPLFELQLVHRFANQLHIFVYFGTQNWLDRIIGQKNVVAHIELGHEIVEHVDQIVVALHAADQTELLAIRYPISGQFTKAFVRIRIHFI
jgi:hypothetical protein